jgi:uncharacterized repeat protein (TIGR01451 family)
MGGDPVPVINDTRTVDVSTLPTVSTTAVSSITASAASSGGDVLSDGGKPVTARGVCWDTSTNPTVGDSKTSDGTGTGVFSSSMTGLSMGTPYYVRAYATNSHGTAYGAERSFTTSDLPTVTTGSVSGIDIWTASGGGNVTDDGGAAVTARGVCWNNTGNPTIADNKTTDGAGTGSYTSELSNLRTDVTYHIRAYATNSVGTAYGAEVTYMYPTLPDPVTDDGDSGENFEDDAEDGDDGDGGDGHDNAGEPNLQVELLITHQQINVGDEIIFRVDVQNIGDGPATNAVLRIPTSPETVFSHVRLIEDGTPETPSLDASVESGMVVIELGDIEVAEMVKMEVILEAKASGAVELGASVTSDEQTEPGSGQATTEVNDVYWEVVHYAPLPCGNVGMVSLLGLVGFFGFRRRR